MLQTRMRSGFLSVAIGFWLVFILTASCLAASQKGVQEEKCVRYSIPASVMSKTFILAGDTVPIQRPDVHDRIVSQVNFLLMDARSVLTDWLYEKSRYSWIFEEIFEKEGIPQEFALLAPILSGAGLKSQHRGTGAGWWSLEKPCTSRDGVTMADDAWHDDRLDLELSTKCFSAKIKQLHKDLGSKSWSAAAAAYVTSLKAVQDAMATWNSDRLWDIPLPEPAEDILVRWIAFSIIASHQADFGLHYKQPNPFVFDQITGLRLQKDLSVGDAARYVGISPREFLDYNPKIKPGSGSMQSSSNGNDSSFALAVPKGKGKLFLEKLKTEGYLLK